MISRLLNSLKSHITMKGKESDREEQEKKERRVEEKRLIFLLISRHACPPLHMVAASAVRAAVKTELAYRDDTIIVFLRS